LVILDFTYQIYLNLIYQIARCHAPEGNTDKSEIGTYNSKRIYHHYSVI